MSQSRARKPHCIGGETVSNGRPFTVKASGDSAPCPPHSQPKQNGRSKNNIPKSIRYDLENALVGLCDVWFEDIKPHLVRNKIKLHVDTSGATASGDYGRLPPAAPGCSHLDPGAASDLHQQASASSAGYYLTQRTASKSRSHRPPAPRPPPPPRPPPLSPLTPPHWTSQNKNSKSKSPRRTRKVQPPPPSTSNWQVPRLCRTYSLLSPQLSPRTRQRRVQTATPVTHKKEENCLLSLVPRRRTNTRNKYTQTEILYTKSHAERLNFMKRTNTEVIAYSANKIPTIRHKHAMNIGLVHSRNSQPAPRRSIENSLNNETYPLTRNPSSIQRLNRKYNKMHREAPETMDIDSVPSKTQNQFQSSQKQSKRELTVVKTVVSAAQRQRSRENRSNSNSAPQKLPTQEKRRADPSVAPPPRNIQEKRSNISHLTPRNRSPVTQPMGNQFWRCFATTNLNPMKNKKQEGLKKEKKLEEPSMLFGKELIDIIASKNDKRLKVLYKNTAQADFPSVMNLVPSSGDREKEASSSNQKTLPWR